MFIVVPYKLSLPHLILKPEVEHFHRRGMWRRNFAEVDLGIQV